MITKSIVYEVAICNECNHIMVYKPASQGLPSACTKCGVPHNVELDQNQRIQMERMREGRQGGVHFMRF